jgi:hypothetical protein
LIRDEATCRRHSPAGFYLLSQAEWRRVRRQREEGRWLWREHFAGELKGNSARSAVVLAERRIGELP